MTTGISVSETINTAGAGTITGATVNNLDPGCAGATMNVTLNTGATTTSTSAAIPSGGGTVTVTFPTSPAFVNNAEVDAVVTGP